MRAVSVGVTGGRERLELVTAADPEPRAGELTIDVVYAGVGFVDTLFRRGVLAHPLPFVPGIEVAGHVRALGHGVLGLRVGDAVAALLNDFGPDRGSGGYAEIATARAPMTVKLGSRFELDQAAALAINGTTAWMAVHEVAKLAKGETALVLGATGGLGTLVGKVAHAAGARALAVVGSAPRKELAKRIGFDEAYLVDEIGELDGISADAAFDTVGGRARQAAFEALRPFGRLVILGNASGEDPPISGDAIWHGTKVVAGLSTGGVASASPARVGEAARKLFALAADGGLGTQATCILPLTEAAEAHRRLEEREGAGKIVLAMR